MNHCVTKSFQLAICPFKPGAFVPVSVQDFEKYITHKYELTVMSWLQPLTLALRHGANPFFFNRFIRLLRQNMFKNLTRLSSVRLHLATILNSKFFSSDDGRPDLTNKPTNAVTESFKLIGYNNILHPDFRPQGQLLLQAWLGQTRSIFAQILKRLSDWQSRTTPFLHNFFSTSGALNAKPSSQKEKYFSSAQRISQLVTSPATCRHGLVKRMMPKFKENFFNRLLHHTGPYSAIDSSDDHHAPFFPISVNGPLNKSIESPGEVSQQKFFNRINCPFRVLVDFPTTTLRNYRPKRAEDIEGQNSIRHMSVISHLTLKPFRQWPDSLFDKEKLENTRLPGQVYEYRSKLPPALIDKRTRHFMDNASRQNNAFSLRTPPKMEMAVSEKKAVPDFKNQFQQQLKKIESAESSPAHGNIDIHHISERVYNEIERKLRIERERRGM
jgi:hypothetical protein